MKKLQILGLTALLLTCVPATAFSASTEDMEAFKAMLTDDTMPFMLREYDENEEDMMTTVVFAEAGTRYTVILSVFDAGMMDSLLTVYTRPNGTTNPEVVDTLQDYKADGVVDQAFDAAFTKDFSLEPAPEVIQNLQFLPYWQDKLDAVIAAGLAYKKRVAK